MKAQAKIFISLVLSLLLLISCGKKKTAELTIWVNYNDEEYAVFSELVSRYSMESKVRINVERIPFMGTEQKILSALATRTTPDIARVDVAFVATLAKRGALHSLDNLPGIDTLASMLVPAAFQSVVIDGRIYGIPDQVTCLALFYNKELFRKSGLDPKKPPQTWDEFLLYARKLTKKDEGIYGFAMHNTLWWTLPFLYTFGADFINGDTCALNTPEAISAFKFKFSLYEPEHVEPGAWKPGAVDPDMGFQSGKYAMVLNGPWKIKTLRDMKIDFGVALIPAGKAGSGTAIGGTDMVIFKNSNLLEQSFKFLKWLVSKENQATWANRLGQIPVNIESFGLVDTITHPYLPIFMKQLQTAHPRPTIMNYSEIENEVNPEMELALTGKKTVEQMVNDACAKINAILQQESLETEGKKEKPETQ